MKQLVGGCGMFIALIAMVAACSSAPSEKVGKAEQRDEANPNGDTTYTCPASCGCGVDADGLCSCPLEVNPDGTCGTGLPAPGVPINYVWNPCPSGQSLHCNVFGSCWCA